MRTKVVSTFEHGGATYEQRSVACGKKTCAKCWDGQSWRPGHGPYWYLRVRIDGYLARIVLGKSPDVLRFRDSSGILDIAAIREHLYTRKGK